MPRMLRTDSHFSCLQELIKPIRGMEDAESLLAADLKQHCFFSESIAQH